MDNNSKLILYRPRTSAGLINSLSFKLAICLSNAGTDMPSLFIINNLFTLSAYHRLVSKFVCLNI